MSTEALIPDLVQSSLDAMKNTGPQPLLAHLTFQAQMKGLDIPNPEQSLVDALMAATGESMLHFRLRQQLAYWDTADEATWANASSARTEERRRQIYEALALPIDQRDTWNALFPVSTGGEDIIISTDFSPWYKSSLAERPPFYWDHYESYLRKRRWHPDALTALDKATTRVVERLADPERHDAYQAKGLVVGYVQSGKTANFTGVIAKAIDAGYRLIIVLTGTNDLLRGQTQRRLDKELVGQENLLRGINADEYDGVDYYGDPDWNEFVRHGGLPSELHASDVHRLTTTSSDYRPLKQGIEALDFQRLDPSKPLNARENLRRVPARLAVVKKNGLVLGHFVRDLDKITARLADIPTLVIDDESDQASLNTTDPAKWKQGQKTRSTINARISDILRALPRAQYVGYTATPFANVFADPADGNDIFPSNFILSLDRPPGYMGAEDFHDLRGAPNPATVENSNELAYVRDVIDDEDYERLSEAIDAFVLAGALKLYREQQGDAIDARHHTMLVHEAREQAAHRQTRDAIKNIWDNGSWMQPRAAKRLQTLYERDFLPVMEARAGEASVPASFDEVRAFIGLACTRIQGSDGKPAWIVNGDKEVAELNLDFGARPIWKILVGGAKLSRGFTVEGLTVSYYVRLTAQADTLMQMGRWFGFRPGYRDLVRLYVGRSSDEARRRRDIYEAFEAACRSEEMFRHEIARYSEMVDDKPQITPAEVPPLVAQHLPWLKPTARNKMYNAKLVERRTPGARLEPTGYPGDVGAVAHNAKTMKPLIEAATQPDTFEMSVRGTFDAFRGTVTHAEFVSVLAALKWSPADHFQPDLKWLARLDSGKIEDWVIVLPQLVGQGATRDLFGLQRSVHERARREGRALFGGIADPKHRLAADRIASNAAAGTDANAKAIAREKRGAALIYPVFETTKAKPHLPDEIEPTRLTMGLVIATPKSTGSPDQPLVRFVAHDPSKSAAIIDA